MDQNRKKSHDSVIYAIIIIATVTCVALFVCIPLFYYVMNQSDASFEPPAATQLRDVRNLHENMYSSLRRVCVKQLQSPCAYMSLGFNHVFSYKGHVFMSNSSDQHSWVENDVDFSRYFSYSDTLMGIKPDYCIVGESESSFSHFVMLPATWYQNSIFQSCRDLARDKLYTVYSGKQYVIDGGRSAKKGYVLTDRGIETYLGELVRPGSFSCFDVNDDTTKFVTDADYPGALQITMNGIFSDAIVETSDESGEKLTMVRSKRFPRAPACWMSDHVFAIVSGKIFDVVEFHSTLYDQIACQMSVDCSPVCGMGVTELGLVICSGQRYWDDKKQPSYALVIYAK